MPLYSDNVEFDRLIESRCAEADILVVEDSPIMAAMYENMLASYGKCRVAPDAKTAIKHIKDKTPDLVVLDHHLPDSTGISVCKTIRKHHAKAKLPVLIVTGSDDKDVERKFWEAGCSDFVHKPVEAITLQQRVGSHLQLKFAFELLREVSNKDALTGLPNRRSLESMVSDIESSRNTLISLLVIDIDYFKQYNDHYGHQAGDECLESIGQLLTENTRGDSETAFRFGGEEFLIVLRGESIETARIVAERIRANVEKAQMEHEKSSFKVVTVSIGVASSNKVNSWESLVGEADENLYKSKQQGRNRVTG
ncbi:diguanylate cyclase [Aestuariibacter salexigens]|uniref:GGDEF domain-containing response regulator n=1 Tax=Aestuariibacter salexigens TaxID=226010 RepID=UPI00041E6C5B|nr:diguanylate cyclase [Aestuariibacter salexigens]